MKSIKTTSMALALMLLMSPIICSAMEEEKVVVDSTAAMRFDKFCDWSKNKAKDCYNNIKDNQTIKNILKGIKEDPGVKQGFDMINKHPKVAIGVGIGVVGIASYYCLKNGWRVIKSTVKFLASGVVVATGLYVVYRQLASNKTTKLAN